MRATRTLLRKIRATFSAQPERRTNQIWIGASGGREHRTSWLRSNGYELPPLARTTPPEPVWPWNSEDWGWFWTELLDSSREPARRKHHRKVKRIGGIYVAEDSSTLSAYAERKNRRRLDDRGIVFAEQRKRCARILRTIKHFPRFARLTTRTRSFRNAGSLALSRNLLYGVAQYKHDLASTTLPLRPSELARDHRDASGGFRRGEEQIRQEMGNGSLLRR